MPWWLEGSTLPWGRSRRGNAPISFLMSGDGMPGNGLELHWGKFRWDIRSTGRVLKHCYKLPKEVQGSELVNIEEVFGQCS